MEIVNVRVDARGIHGQVATAWAKHLGIHRIMVIDDKTTQNDIQKMALKMACPAGIKLSILSCEKAKERLNDPEAYVNEKLMIILINVETLAELEQLGYRFETVNMGNLPSRPNTEEIRKTIHLTIQEKDIIKRLAEKGTRFTAQMVPTDNSVDFLSLLK